MYGLFGVLFCCVRWTICVARVNFMVWAKVCSWGCRMLVAGRYTFGGILFIRMDNSDTYPFGDFCYFGCAKDHVAIVWRIM